ncbi:VOC family protein [Nocardioides sp. W7]|uniref:VOC family protein n=1 Tax=Nocardioides sp. W7 TaxID=2931390 RepID=UPI001FD14130|nr:VOC family protein [Nocardioides sp. W7]
MAVATVFPCLWFNSTAKEAADFYVTLMPHSHVDRVWRSPTHKAGPEATVLTVDFTVAGQRLPGLNGGPHFSLSEAVVHVLQFDVVMSLGPVVALGPPRPARSPN